MSNTTILLIMIGMGLITYGLRVSMFVWVGQRELPPYLSGALQYVPAAVLSAIIAPELFMPQDTLDISLGNVRLIAGLVAVVVAWRTKSVLWTMVIGMIVLWILQIIAGTV
ncbi:MAG: AzlD domain-containing protein [Chloroflexota bacterium]